LAVQTREDGDCASRTSQIHAEKGQVFAQPWGFAILEPVLREGWRPPGLVPEGRPGALKRLYLDRIFAPSPQSGWQNLGSITEVPNLTCPKCGTLIGSPMIYRSRVSMELLHWRLPARSKMAQRS